jgi:AAA+ ATPase superfamily predicted ATPase
MGIAINKEAGMLRFYDREKEIAFLDAVEQKSRKTAQMTCVMGRRRIGKTALLRAAFLSGLNTTSA